MPEMALGQPDAAGVLADNVELHGVAVGYGAVAVLVQQFFFFDHAVQLGAGVHEDRGLAHLDDLAGYLVADVQVVPAAFAVLFEQFGKGCFAVFHAIAFVEFFGHDDYRIIKGLCEQCLGEVLAVERAQVFHFLAEPDKGDREFVLQGYGHHDAALGRAVQFGQDDFVHAHGLVEQRGLGQGVLAGGGVDDQDAAVGRAFVLLADNPLDLGQFLHEVDLGVQPACGVYDQ